MSEVTLAVDRVTEVANREGRQLPVEDAFNFYAELASYFDSAAEALREENQPESEEW